MKKHVVKQVNFVIYCTPEGTFSYKQEIRNFEDYGSKGLLNNLPGLTDFYFCYFLVMKPVDYLCVSNVFINTQVCRSSDNIRDSHWL